MLIAKQEAVLVKVYFAKVTDTTRAETTVTSHKGTAEWIAMLPGGEMIPDTAEEVDAADLDGQGRYIPRGGIIDT